MYLLKFSKTSLLIYLLKFNMHGEHPPLSMHIETPAEGRGGGCSRMTVSATAIRSALAPLAPTLSRRSLLALDQADEQVRVPNMDYPPAEWP